MTDARLIIYDPTNSDAATPVGTLHEIPIKITMAISDVREPDKRNSSFSKTITLPGTAQINKIFEHIFNVTTELANFNPNLKTRCKYMVRSEKIFEGDLQLLKVKRTGISPMVDISYEVSIVGRLANIFLDLGNALLTDLDFSDLNHVFTYANRNWTPTLGTGYTYPLIDYGVNGGNTWVWDFAHLKAAIFEKEYIDRIFESIGKTYTSTYFSGTYGSSIIIPNNRAGAYKMTNSQINDVSFYAGKTADTTGNIPLTYNAWFIQNNIVGGWLQSNYPTLGYGLNISVFNDDTTAPFYDGGNNYSTVSSAFFTPQNLEYKFACRCDFEIRVNAPAGTTSMYINNGNGNYTFDVGIVVQGINVVVGSFQCTPNYTNWTAASCTVQIPYQLIQAGVFVYVAIAGSDPVWMNTVFYNGVTPITAGTASVDVKLKSTSWFSGTTATGNLPIGYTVDMNQCVPKDIKQIDFLMNVIKSENLYMELDLTDTNNYIIESREDFYLANSQALDWTSKWDYEKETEILPMGELDFREMLFTYKTDGDKYNKRYRDAFGETYGQEWVQIENDFIRTQKKTELIFAATPMVGNSVNSLVYPVLAKEEGSTLVPCDTTIRRLYWGGTKQTLNGFYSMVNGSNGPGLATMAIYPFAGSVDDPYTPTLSLDWGIPKLLYYEYPGQVWTNNNLYVRNYKRFIDSITDANSKIVTMWIYLRASDIANFTFRKPIFIRDSYYLVNRILEYDPQNPQSTKVEFLRLAFVDAPVVEDILVWDNGAGVDSGFNYGMVVNGAGQLPNGNVSESDGIATGQNNVNNGSGSGIYGGYNNVIGNEGGDF